MKFFSPCFLLVVGTAAAATDTRLVRETEALTPDQERAALHAPVGFEIRLFAAEPMINKPINMAFDERGRLWVSSTVEYPYAADRARWSDAMGTRVKGSRDAVKILEDTDGDGVADKVTDFADELNIPTGVLPWRRPGDKAGCIAWSIPNIWYFGDKDGDDRADTREVLFGPLGYEKDTHGMCSSFRLGMDGWIYATHGFNNTSHFKARDGGTLDLHSGNVFRFRPDASSVEIWSWGQVNPFGLCFDQRHNLYSADCHSAPIYQLLRGAHYPSFNKPHGGLGHAPVMCAHTHGSTGICGVVYVDGGIWGEEWEDHMLVGNVVTSRINQDAITFTGTSPRATERPDFMTSDDPWFRPVDLQIGPDSALYIADFYNRIIGHYEVPLDHPGRDRERGRIWRVVKADAGTARRVVKRLEVGESNAALLAALGHDDSFVRRAAAEAAGDRPSPALIQGLLELAARTAPGDTHLAHATRLALRECLSLPGAFAALPTPVPAEVYVVAPAVPTAAAAEFLLNALLAKHQTGEGGEVVLTWLKHVARHGEGDAVKAAVDWAREWAASLPARQAECLRAMQDGLSERGAPANPALLRWGRELAERLLGQLPTQTWQPVSGPGPGAVWALVTRKCADGKQAEVLQSMRGGGDQERLTGVMRSAAFELPARLSFWLCGHRGAPTAAAHEDNLVRLVLEDDGKVAATAFPPRGDVCQRVEWDLRAFAGKRGRLEIVDGDDKRAYAWLGITRIDPPVADITTFREEDQHRAALKLVAAIVQHTAPASLRERLAPYQPATPAPAPLPVSPEQRRALDELIRRRSSSYHSSATKGNAARGAQAFATHCAACHQVAGQGGLIGPQLDGIGNRGVERLCEDILDPNRNVDAHFHLHTLKLKDGRTLSGFVKGEGGQMTVFADATGQEFRVQKADIQEEQSLPISLMPPVFGQTIAEGDFHDLLAWLLTK